jgi:hypothetical protein
MYAPGFEGNFSLRLQKLVCALPPDAARLQMNSQADFVAFEILPTNQKSARIEGEASTQGGITFTVGRATGVELSTSQQDRFFQVCEAIFTSRFSESLVYSSKGHVLYSQIRLEIKGRNVRLGGQRLLWRLFPNKRNELFQYQPYF